jgi:hypothetical protein
MTHPPTRAPGPVHCGATVALWVPRTPTTRAHTHTLAPTPQDIEPGQLRILEVDERLVLPTNTLIRVLVSACRGAPYHSQSSTRVKNPHTVTRRYPCVVGVVGVGRCVRLQTTGWRLSTARC